MAERRRPRRIPEKPKAEAEPAAEPGKAAKPVKDEGAETSADARIVNISDTNPEMFKDPLIGKTLGKCKIRRLIGEGQTAVVFEALFEPLNRTVAIKVLQQHMTKVPAVLKVFQQEGRAVAALDHENVIKIFDVGEDQGYHYIVLELLRGRDLLKVLSQGGEEGLPTTEVLGYIRQAAAGLDAAHRKNLVHRDIKPQNLVLEPDGKLKIVDFGLAAEARGAYAGGRLGTPHYMSPEQCRGEHAVPNSDIYSLGITFYHLLAGYPPFAGMQTKEEIIAEHLKGRRLEVEKARADIPRPVADLIRKMTRMDPASRPSAREVTEIIDRILEGEGEAAGPAGRGGRRRGGRQASPGPMAAVAGLVLLLVIVLIVVLSRGKDEDPAKKPAGQPTPSPVVTRPLQPDTPSVPAVEQSLEEKLREAFAEAEKLEKIESFEDAQFLYARVVQMAPTGSEWARRAKKRSDDLILVIDAKKTGKMKPSKVYITVQESAQAAEEFRKREAEFRASLAALQPTSVRSELERLRDHTREDAPERTLIEQVLRRVSYVEGLLAMAQSRAPSLGGGRERWVAYDLSAPGELIIVSADEQGIRLRNTDSHVEEVRAWSQIHPALLVTFFDALRNESSANEAIWLGYYCRLQGNDLADTYFDRALLLDGSAEVKNEVAALRTG